MCAKLAHMSVIDSEVLGAQIREARERAGLKQSELGSAVGLDRTAVSKIEGGVRKVTALELSAIATALDVRMSSLLTEPVPALVSHRSSQGLDTADSKIDRLLASLAADVEFVGSLAPEELGLSKLEGRIEGLPFPRPFTMSDADELGSKARALLGLDGAQPVRDLVALAASVGLLMFSADLGVDTADAGTILLRQGGVSLINSQNKVGRRRLAAAHELGHYLIADQYTVDWRVSGQSSDVEARLDRFARAMLVPELGVRAAWSRHSERFELRETAVHVASEFRVDMTTLARRLQDLGLIGGEEAAIVRGITTRQADIVEFGLVVPVDLEGTTLPLPFQKAVLRLFRDERISRDRALNLLQDTFNNDDLPALRARREDEIWNFVS